MTFAIAAALLLVVLVLVGLGALEYSRLVRQRNSIRIRIHVNGTRGKSSTVRLIAAALRAHGVRTYAKTTGSLPRLIAPDGSELPVFRPGLTNVIEQLRMIAIAAEDRADAVVLECMALEPRLQALCELRILRSTHGVISNAWPDHLDVMGPTTRDVAEALLGTCPANGVLFTGEREHLALFERACADRHTRLVCVGDAEAAAITDAELARFDYIEHSENVALALAVCGELGIPRETALAGMWSAEPDVGALREYAVEFFGRQIVFVNGFAANDPVATERVWNLALARHPECETRLMVLNCRLDRPDRSLQLGEALPRWALADHYFLIGTGTFALARTAVSAGLPGTRLTPLEGESPAEVFEELVGAAGRSALVVGAGNIADIGLELLRYFENRARLPEGRAA
ncbi:MAG TPA: poly-gamma-glutamate synthase PgsB [Myxococcota bacterium]|nr:poly-gamma-glutamate synthase PgsB [Myxococcota bacterium]